MSFGIDFCFASLTQDNPALLARSIIRVLGRVTLLSCSSKSNSSELLTFSFTTMTPLFSLNPSLHLWKKFTKSSSVKYMSTHWHQMTSYRPASGVKSWRPQQTQRSTRDEWSPMKSLDWSRKFWFCSTMSTASKSGSRSCFVMRPIPAPQSKAREVIGVPVVEFGPWWKTAQHR